MRGRALVFFFLVACAGPLPTAREPVTREPTAEPRTCTDLRHTVQLDFRCLDDDFDLAFRDNDELIDVFLTSLASMPALEQVRVEAFTARDGRERDEADPDLARRRAESVADELARRGIDRARIAAIGGGAYHGALDSPDDCPPPADDVGHPHRRARLNVIVCR